MQLALVNGVNVPVDENKIDIHSTPLRSAQDRFFSRAHLNGKAAEARYNSADVINFCLFASFSYRKNERFSFKIDMKLSDEFSFPNAMPIYRVLVSRCARSNQSKPFLKQHPSVHSSAYAEWQLRPSAVR